MKSILTKGASQSYVELKYITQEWCLWKFKSKIQTDCLCFVCIKAQSYSITRRKVYNFTWIKENKYRTLSNQTIYQLHKTLKSTKFQAQTTTINSPITLYQDRNHNSTSLNNKKHKLERLSKTKQKKHLVADTFHKSVRLKVQTKNKPQSQQNREN